NPARRRQHADRVLGHLGVGDEPFPLAQSPHQIGPVVPELPPAVVETLVALQGVGGPGRLDHLGEESVCDGPAALDFVETSVGDVQRPSFDSVQRVAGDVVTGDVGPQQRVRLRFQWLEPRVVGRDDERQPLAVVYPLKTEDGILQRLRFPRLAALAFEPWTYPLAVLSVRVPPAAPRSLVKADDRDDDGRLSGPGQALPGEVDVAPLDDLAETDRD